MTIPYRVHDSGIALLPIYFTNSYRLVTFYINMLMLKLFKHVNCPAIFFPAFDKPCIPLKTSMKSLFMSRNGHDKSMTKMYGNGNWILRLDIFVAALINYRRQFTIKTKGSSSTDLMVK
jgi:hypothetical protein